MSGHKSCCSSFEGLAFTVILDPCFLLNRLHGPTEGIRSSVKKPIDPDSAVC